MQPFFIARSYGLKMISEVTSMPEKDDQYQIESDARTLIEAEMIKRTPDRHKKAIAQIKKENAARKNAVKS